ncbi:mevalonate kinase-like isoform X2 [Nylanderia fulva]|uniref:mevalonate kinase-like isoform X2 n=1 Tax=Nylanderia fulva TaxID=613905 RepID=UPI0010FBA623|nr:mevalonate kinase-like isoform X2 [Nylanderia fulva]
MNKKMIKFKISAPGEIILSGEHTVMFGKHFVVAGLDLRTNLEFCELSDEQTNIRIEFQDYEKDVPLQEVQYLFSRLIRENLFSDQVNLLKKVDSFIDVNNMWEKPEEKISLQMFFFLLFIIIYDMEHEVKPFRLRVSTEIPFGDCFGSSTSFAVCLAACFLRWKRLQSGDYIRFNEQDLQKIEHYTKSCENIMVYSTFKPLDAKVCIYGSINKCISNNYQSCSIEETINLTTGMKILLIDTHRLQSDKYSIYLQMLELKYFRPSYFNSILNDLEKIATRIFNDLYNINNNIKDPDAYSNLQRDIKRNQQMLSRYDLSYFEFDIITCLGGGFNLSGKLTGFGGRYVYFLLPPRITQEEIKRITNFFRIKDAVTKLLQ